MSAVDPDVGPLPDPVPPLRTLLRRDLTLLPAISLGGASGSLARWVIADALPVSVFPWGTFAVNVVGCLLLGVLMTLVEEVWPPRRWLRPFFGVGVLGGFTTFSTAMLDLHGLLAADRLPLALLYAASSVIVGLLAAAAGVSATRRGLRKAP